MARYALNLKLQSPRSQLTVKPDTEGVHCPTLVWICTALLVGFVEVVRTIAA